MKMIKQIIRGTQDLPHVGPHPGTGVLIMFLLLGVISGASSGADGGAIFGGIMTAIFVLPIYLIGSYDRANTSDRLQRAMKD